MRLVPVLAITALTAALPVPARAGDPAPEKRIADAFRKLDIGPAARVEKDAAPLLPAGIVIEAGPFDAVVRKLLEPHASRLDERDRAAAADAATPAAATALVAALKTLEAENAEYAVRVAAVEDAYGEVYDAGWMESGEKTHRTRKLAAVLIPFYRTLAARNAAVAARAGAALAGAKDDARVAWLAQVAAGDATPSARAAAVAALGRIGGADALPAVRKVRESDPVPAVRTAALSALLSWKVADVQDAVIAALGDSAWEVRALAAAICARGQVVAAADALVAALEREDGRLRRDLDDALAALTGQRYYGDAALWRRWLDEHRAEMEAKARTLAEAGAPDRVLGPVETWDDAAAPASGGPGGDEARRGTTWSFYGIDSPSRRVLFVIDISKSMEEASAAAPPPVTTGTKDPYPGPQGKAKIDVAKWQLHRAVAALPKDAAFDIVVYSESYKAWAGQMTDATSAARTKAHAFIDALKPNGTTNICDSVDAAFEIAGAAPLALPSKGKRPGLAADTVYLLSDGAPNRGRLSDPAALLDAVVARNRTARLVFHTIGIGEAAGSALLQSLAARTGGQYVGFR